MRVLIAILLAVALHVANVNAQDDTTHVLRPVASVFMADVGHSSILDTYLTPITYGGMNIGLAYAATQSTGFSPHKWVRQLSLGTYYSSVENRVGNNNMHVLMAEAQWGMMRRWKGVFKPELQFMLGGMTRLAGGAIYDAANSNNVVSVKAHWSVGLMGMAVYNTHFSRMPVTISYQASLPLIGVFFSPDYDESYYEMYLGNHNRLANFGYLGNRFDMANMVSVDLHLGATILRLGYRNRIERSYVHNLNTHITTHTFVVGIGGEFLSTSRRQLSPQAKIISSMY